MSRYETGLGDEFEPGSNGRVLRNHLGIIDPVRAGLVETELLRIAYTRAVRSVTPEFTIDTKWICRFHREWLGALYPFAGTLRIVNVSKDGFLFAPAEYLPEGLAELNKLFARLMPCTDLALDQLCASISESHAELVLTHPFREGNGRLSRAVADLMAIQAGYRPLQWKIDNEPGRRDYFAALRRGFLKDFKPLEKLVREALHGQ